MVTTCSGFRPGPGPYCICKFIRFKTLRPNADYKENPRLVKTTMLEVLKSLMSICLKSGSSAAAAAVLLGLLLSARIVIHVGVLDL